MDDAPGTELERGPAAPRRSARWIAAFLGLVCTVVYLASPVYQLYDSRYLTAVSYSLLHQGSLEIPPSAVPGAPSERYQIQAGDDRILHFFPMAPAILNVPFVWLFERFGVRVVDEAGRLDPQGELLVLRASAAVAAGLAVALLFLTARL